jgi:hypothetical protein
VAASSLPGRRPRQIGRSFPLPLRYVQDASLRFGLAMSVSLE